MNDVSNGGGVSGTPSVFLQDADVTLWHGGAWDVLRALPDGVAHACVTSPPYLDARPEYPSPTIIEFGAIFKEIVRVAPGPLLLNVGRLWRDGIENRWWEDLLRQASRAGFSLLDTLVWVKPNANPIHGRVFSNSHEYVFILGRFDEALNTDAIRTPYSSETLSRTERNWGLGAGVKNGGARTGQRKGLNPAGARPRSYVSIYTGREKGNPHPAPMALELAMHLVALASWEGQTVLDPFAGSGTTCLAARKLGRHSIGIDLSAEYLALAARRLQQQSLFAEVV